MKKIRIQSTQTIIVTPDLKVKDLTDTNSMNPNKLRAMMDWQDEPVKVLYGTHEYDAKIKEWQSVKALVEAEIFSIMDVVELPKKPQMGLNKENKAKLEE